MRVSNVGFATYTPHLIRNDITKAMGVFAIMYAQVDTKQAKADRPALRAPSS